MSAAFPQPFHSRYSRINSLSTKLSPCVVIILSRAGTASILSILTSGIRVVFLSTKMYLVTLMSFVSKISYLKENDNPKSVPYPLHLSRLGSSRPWQLLHPKIQGLVQKSTYKSSSDSIMETLLRRDVRLWCHFKQGALWIWSAFN